jgi:AcrR family transcriptional regulator
VAPIAADGAGEGGERELICAALIDAVASRGYRSTSVEHVIERAAVDQVAFDRNFAGLEDCFAAAWDAIDAELRRRMAAAFARRSDWQDRLRAAFSVGLDYLASDEPKARVFVAEAVYVSEDLRDRQRDALVRLCKMVDLGRHEAPESSRTQAGIAEAVAGAVWHRVQQLVQAGRGAELPHELPRLMYIAVLPYRGAAAAEAELTRS